MDKRIWKMQDLFGVRAPAGHRARMATAMAWAIFGLLAVACVVGGISRADAVGVATALILLGISAVCIRACIDPQQRGEVAQAREPMTPTWVTLLMGTTGLATWITTRVLTPNPLIRLVPATIVVSLTFRAALWLAERRDRVGGLRESGDGPSHQGSPRR